MIGFLQCEAEARRQEADAWRAHADTLLTTVGLDPAVATAVAELAEVIGDTAADFGMAVRRFVTIYDEVLKAVSEGLILPHNARDWLTGEI
jgi:hypothetical protein